MGIRKEIVRKLRDLEVDESVEQLVSASLLGPGAVAAVLKGETVAAKPETTDSRQSAASVYLQSITVQGFRGIGPKATLELDAQPGLTLVVGRNGSGKSSFFDGLEVLLTGDSFRWKGKTAVWKNGWRNLHMPTGAGVTAKFQVEGVAGETTVEKSWADDVRNVSDSATTAQHLRQKRTDLAGIGWSEPLELYRPILSHPELGSIALKPSGLYDTFNKVLGMEETTQALGWLSKARRDREQQIKAVNDQLKKEIRPLLNGINDDRAERASENLSGWKWQLAQLENLLTGDTAPSIRSLRELSTLELPSAEEVAEISGKVEKARLMLESLRGSSLHRSSDLARLLKVALQHQERHSEDICPVCMEGGMDDDWLSATQIRVAELSKEARRYRKAETGLKKALKLAHHLVQPPPLPDDTPIDVGRLVETWKRWNDLPERPSDVPGHLIEMHSQLTKVAETLSQQAGELYSEQEERWAPVKAALIAWLPTAWAATELRPVIRIIKTAESILSEIAEGLRNDRWEPIENQALEIWGELRLQSNIDLDSIALTGRGPRRQVALNATVDGKEFQALGVASQGELNCLALSLFFPRGTLPESPFRFLIIDDPVQAMDPARVDGLARVFDKVASGRQLVVFTHDDRLPESLRRLDLSHQVLEVTRQKKSLVTVRSVLGPVEQYLEDAWAVAMEDTLTSSISQKVVPGFCRQALEAACVERIRRERIGQGALHAEVEKEIDQANTLMQKVALALLGNVSEASKVRGAITQRWGKNLAGVLGVCNRGTHSGYPGDLRGLINDSRRLATRIRNRF